LIILTFHGIGRPHAWIEGDEPRVWITGDRFERILDLVADQADASITFDDGNRSDVEVALPALLRRKMRAIFFVVAARVGLRGYLSGDDLKDLVSAGMTIGSHGMRHRPWTALSQEELQEEGLDARTKLEGLTSERVRLAACPFGAYDRASLRMFRGAGFERVFTSDRQPAIPDKWLQPRYTVHAEDTDSDIRRVLAGQARRAQWVHELRCAVKQWRTVLTP
jgi:peptidoglycan/xylan/chitin deacetylase (PgdA/CDA1 family)